MTEFPKFTLNTKPQFQEAQKTLGRKTAQKNNNKACYFQTL